MMNVDDMWDTLMNEYGVSEETLRIITDINGYSETTMLDVLWAVAGERSFEDEADDDESLVEEEPVVDVSATVSAGRVR